jgi:bacterial/archaeal transporter family protein
MVMAMSSLASFATLVTSPSAAWIGLALLSAVFASLVGIFGKVGVLKVDSTLATAVRAIIMAAFLVAAALATGKGALVGTLDRRALLVIAASGVAGALSWLCYFFALQRGPASGVAALDRLSVVFVVLFAAGFLGEPLTPRTALGAALITVGALLFVFK